MAPGHHPRPPFLEESRVIIRTCGVYRDSVNEGGGHFVFAANTILPYPHYLICLVFRASVRLFFTEPN